MKRLLSAVLLTFLFTSCSSDPNSPIEENPTKFEVALTPSSLHLEVDETAVVEIKSSSALSEVKWIKEGGNSRAHSAFDGEKLQEGLKLYFQFSFPGTHNVLLEFKDTNNKITTEELAFEVVPGNTLQITGIEVKSFYDMGKAWDPEATGEAQLADLVFALEKAQQVGFVEDELRTGAWFLSDVHENESSLSWELLGEQLYLNPIFGFYFSLGDVDEGGMGQNLLLDQPSYKIELRDKVTARPETISLIDEEVNLHVIFHLNWP